MTELNEKTAALVRMARANDKRLKDIKRKQKNTKAQDKNDYIRWNDEKSSVSY